MTKCMPFRSRDLVRQKKEVPERSASYYCMANADFEDVHSDTKSKT